MTHYRGPDRLDASSGGQYNFLVGRRIVANREVCCLPLYEYECSSCHHRFEVLQKFSDKPARTCVRCGGPVAKLISRSSIQFKGTGWSVSDYAGKGTHSAERQTAEKGAAGDSTPAVKESSPSQNVSTKPSESAPKAG